MRYDYEEAPGITAGGFPPSREISWFATFQFLRAVVDQANVGPLPTAGTPSWQAMADGDPRKLLALAEAGVHHVLRVDTEQAAHSEASQEISKAVDCTAIANGIRRQEWRQTAGVYVPKEVA